MSHSGSHSPREVFGSAKRILLSASALVTLTIPVLVFLFGTDVTSRFGKNEPSDGTEVAPVPERGEPSPPSFTSAPFVHPRAVTRLGWDGVGRRVVAIELTDSDRTGRDGELKLRADSLQPSTTWVEHTRPEFRTSTLHGYRAIGTTVDGLIVLHVREAEGGSGVSHRLVFARVDVETRASYPRLGEAQGYEVGKRAVVRESVLVSFVADIPLGDRWFGTVEVIGNEVLVRGRDHSDRCEPGGVFISEADAMERCPPPLRVFDAPVGSFESLAERERNGLPGRPRVSQ